MATLSAALSKELCDALKVQRLPGDFATAIANGLDQYAVMKRQAPDARQVDASIKSVAAAARRFKKEIEFALRLLDRYPMLTTGSTTHKRIRELRLQIDELLDGIKSSRPDPERLRELWPNWEDPQRKRRGNPHEYREFLRDCVFGALEWTLGVEHSRRRGVAGAVMAVVLKEADRLDGRTPEERQEFKAKQWREWLRDYEED